MQARLDKIDSLIAKGYSLEKYKYFGAFEVPIPILKDPNGKGVSTFFGGPAGFSWSGFFFQSAFYVQLREYSYFALLFALYFLTFKFVKSLAAAGILTGGPAAMALVSVILLLFFIYCGSGYPYIRYISSRKSAKKEINIWFALVVGFFLEKLVEQAGLYFSTGHVSTFFKAIGAS